jgi:hypothetical protein
MRRTGKADTFLWNTGENNKGKKGFYFLISKENSPPHADKLLSLNTYASVVDDLFPGNDYAPVIDD